MSHSIGRSALSPAGQTTLCLAVLTALAVAGTCAPASAAPPDAAVIVHRMKDALEPDRASLRKIVMDINTGEDMVEWTARQARKTLPTGKQMLTVMMSPKDVQGIALLVSERKHEAHDAQWFYIPAIRRIRKILPVMANEDFMGTDFTFANLGLVNLRDRAFVFLGEGKVGDTDCYKVQETPKHQFRYARIVDWVAEDTMLPLRREYYDLANQLWRTEEVKDWSVIDGTPTILKLLISDDQVGTSTTMTTSDVQYDVPVPNELFDWERLRVVAQHEIWSSTPTKSAP